MVSRKTKDLNKGEAQPVPLKAQLELPDVHALAWIPGPGPSDPDLSKKIPNQAGSSLPIPAGTSFCVLPFTTVRWHNVD